eukprot:CAMPEP_0175870100 /NCGR_PEP_ID=MMETSP0107_2-20121207/36363_1 /TAXON_ID=195067 ORGANISM="Goniomonas pacifica, Strain CCMP1869" /NCGR_SAMPLE_ID=MMETSP0107_2 /ASSEMBLY_ACC=CAM_ASM_000203 /LENGTH=31 /DNA_ID= /DNA_START= /DNA_END= /DNA_ORIENTATION=
MVTFSSLSILRASSSAVHPDNLTTGASGSLE